MIEDICTNVEDLLHQLEKDNVIKVFYKGKKMYFIFLDNSEEEIEEKKEKIENTNPVNYDCLEDDENIFNFEEE